MALLLVSAGASTYAYPETPTRESGVLAHLEYAAVMYTLLHKIAEDAPIFTGYRISSAFLANDHLEISAVWPGNAEATDSKMRNIYYTNNSSTQTPALRNLTVGGNPPEYVVISNKQTDSNIGVSIGGRLFRNMTDSEYNTFNENEALNKVYESTAVVYKIENG